MTTLTDAFNPQPDYYTNTANTTVGTASLWAPGADYTNPPPPAQAKREPTPMEWLNERVAEICELAGLA